MHTNYKLPLSVLFRSHRMRALVVLACGAITLVAAVLWLTVDASIFMSQPQQRVQSRPGVNIGAERANLFTFIHVGSNAGRDNIKCFIRIQHHVSYVEHHGQDSTVTVAQISDLHISIKHDADRAPNLALLCKQWAGMDLDAIIVTGDLTDAKDENYMTTGQVRAYCCLVL